MMLRLWIVVIALLTTTLVVDAKENTDSQTIRPVSSFLKIARNSKATKAQKQTIEKMMQGVRESDLNLAYEKLKATKVLCLYGSPVYLTDLSPISEFTNLETLVLYNNHITDLQPLATLVNLKTLRLERNRIVDITALQNLIQLESLQIDDNRISNLTPLSNLEQLRTLWIARNNIRDISPLSELHALRDLYLAGNSITNLEPLIHMKSLSDLRLENNGLSDISALSRLNQKTQAFMNLDLSKNKISNVEPISRLERVSSLFLNDNLITDIGSLANPNVSALYLQNNMIKDVSSVRNLPKLSLLDISSNPIQDYAPLLALKRQQPRLVIHGHNFHKALNDSMPTRDALRDSPLIGLWRSDAIESEWGKLIIEMKFENNGLYYQSMKSADTEDEGSHSIDGQYSIKGNILTTIVQGGETKSEYQIKKNVLILKQEGEQAELRRVNP